MMCFCFDESCHGSVAVIINLNVSKKYVTLFTVLMQGWKCVQAPNFTLFYISRLSIDKVRKHITAQSFRYVYHLYLENTKIYRDVVCLVCLCNLTSTKHFCHQWTFRQLHSETVSLSTRTECIETFLQSSTIKFH